MCVCRTVRGCVQARTRQTEKHAIRTFSSQNRHSQPQTNISFLFTIKKISTKFFDTGADCLLYLHVLETSLHFQLTFIAFIPTTKQEPCLAPPLKITSMIKIDASYLHRLHHPPDQPPTRHHDVVRETKGEKKIMRNYATLTARPPICHVFTPEEVCQLPRRVGGVESRCDLNLWKPRLAFATFPSEPLPHSRQRTHASQLLRSEFR